MSGRAFLLFLGSGGGRRVSAGRSKERISLEIRPGKFCGKFGKGAGKASAPIHSSGGWGLLPGFLLHGLFPAFCGVFRQKGTRLPIHKAPGARGTLRRADHLQICASSWGSYSLEAGKGGGAAGEGFPGSRCPFLYLKDTIFPQKSQDILCKINSFHNGVFKNHATCTKV